MGKTRSTRHKCCHTRKVLTDASIPWGILAMKLFTR